MSSVSSPALSPSRYQPVSPSPYKSSFDFGDKGTSNLKDNRDLASRIRPRNWEQFLWLTLFLPIVAFGYLGFCYAAATRIIPVRVYSMDSPEEHQLVIKAGVTTINIIIIGLALLPLQGLLSDLKSEEFFRMLGSSKSKGVPLEAVNDVSTPSYSLIQSLSSIIKNHSSAYYSTAILAGILAVIVSSLAPAALSVGNIVVENDIMAIEVGALLPDSVYNTSIITRSAQSLSNTSAKGNYVDRLEAEAAARGWVQTVIGGNIPFLPNSPRYAVPVPSRIAPNTRARYLTDVITFDPVCSWEISDPPPTPYKDILSVINITFPSQNISTSYSLDTYAKGAKKNIEIMRTDLPMTGMENTTTGGPITNGATVWLVSQLISTAEDTLGLGLDKDQSVIDFTGIPSQKVTFDQKSLDNSTAGPTNTTTMQFSFLFCKPRMSVVTREVRLDGKGGLEVLERTGMKRQKNINDGQARLLLAMSLTAYSTASGPDPGYDGIGKAGQASLFFGPGTWSSGASLSRVASLKPLPLSNITTTYGLAMQAAMISYLSGQFSTTYVPGRFSSSRFIFTCSIPHLIVSTVLFAIITIWVVTARFTLISIAAVMARSNAGERCEDAGMGSGGEFSEGVAFEQLKDHAVLLVSTSYRSTGRICQKAYDPDKAISKDTPRRRTRLIECVAKSWVSLPIHAPQFLDGYDGVSVGHQVDVAIGTPPQNTSFRIFMEDFKTTALTPECVLCPANAMYDPGYSSTFNLTATRVGYMNLSGIRGTETITFGGVLQDVGAPIIFIDHMKERSAAYRFDGGACATAEGSLGLSPSLNNSWRSQNLPLRLYEQNQLLNPVWGLRLSGDNPRLTLGALDSTEFEGEINWVPEGKDSQQVQVDAFRAYEGNIIPFQYPVSARLSTQNTMMFLNMNTTLLANNTSLIGPNTVASIRKADDWTEIQCNGTAPPEFKFSVDINGVNYPVQEVIERSHPDTVNMEGFCDISVGSADEYVLGAVFLRSVYLFPTEDCPGYYGFAFPKGTTATMPTSQKPKTTPSDAVKCLSFATPTSTPTPTIRLNEGLATKSKGRYKVYGQEDVQVELNNIEDLPILQSKSSINQVV
ncbi:hypothetical protein L218DRAFT_1049965 [Marasmius fiardii PR-910]|nr:hypothetical protein L218DRAFT_1049965 [Marasmius fiardii PR-910]